MAPATFYYEKHDPVEVLASGKGSLFESRTRFLIFAANVGFARTHWVENPDDNGEMRWNYISQNQRLSVVTKALTYAHTSDPESILDAEQQIDTLVGYGAGGARIIETEVVEQAGDNLDNLIEFIRAQRDQERAEQRVGVLEQIEAEMSSVRASEESE
jgi:hypothetical protein